VPEDSRQGGRYRLYGRPGTGSAASEAALAEAGADFDIADVAKEPDATARFALVNPRGQVPALVHPDGTVITEGAAILLHIADAFPAARLAPPPGTAARASHDRWLLYFHANVYEGELRRYYPDRYTADPACSEAVETAARDYVQRHYALFENQLEGSDYCLRSGFSVLDIYLWMLVQWMDRDWMEKHCPRIVSVTDRVSHRGHVALAHDRHFGPAAVTT
jgi:GST-like protein